MRCHLVRDNAIGAMADGVTRRSVESWSSNQNRVYSMNSDWLVLVPAGFHKSSDSSLSRSG